MLLDSTDEPVILLVAEDAAGRTVLQATAETLDDFGLRWHWGQPSPEPTDGMELRKRRLRAVVVASSDGKLPGLYAKGTRLPTIRVPVEGREQTELALLRDAAGQLPAGLEDNPFATMAIGVAGAKNAALFIVAALAVNDPVVRKQWVAFRAKQTASVLEGPPPTLAD